MATLKAQNYIHTLFLYEFGVSLVTAIAIRTALQTKMSKCDLYSNWIETRLSQTTLSRFRSTLFECETDKTVYNYRNYDNPQTPNIKCLEISFSVLSTGFYVLLKGLQRGYELEATGNYMNPFASFSENRWQLGIGSSNYKSLTENEFYNKVDQLLNVVVSTNKLPFELYHIQ